MISSIVRPSLLSAIKSNQCLIPTYMNSRTSIPTSHRCGKQVTFKRTILDVVLLEIDIERTSDEEESIMTWKMGVGFLATPSVFALRSFEFLTYDGSVHRVFDQRKETISS